ncbi:hypothetical protein AN958_02924 [Leucoagaricus sp. SymC.cos]|nr:hypothetical protein AN958_02924 [Leucoagaricus sp. SymC.cos]
MLDEGQLQLDLKLDEGGLIYVEEKRKGQKELCLVGAVFRNVCENQEALDMVDETIRESVDAQRDIRMDDAGHLSLNGFTAGSRNAPKFHWAKNIIHRNYMDDGAKKLNYRVSATFALFWNMVKGTAPEDVINDFKQFLLNTGIASMDGSGQMSYDENGKGTYTVEIGDGSGSVKLFTFKDVELSPPCSASAENYARFIHREAQPHEFSTSWTTSRFNNTGLPDNQLGGNFFIAPYGIRIQSTANTMICWRSREWHGTSLHTVCGVDSRGSPLYHQRGISFVTSNHIPKVWRSYDKGSLSEESVAQQIFGLIPDPHGNQDIADGLKEELDAQVISEHPRRSSRKKALTRKAQESEMALYKSWMSRI